MPNVPLIEELRWKKFPVLDEGGFVCLVDCMGDDAAIVQSGPRELRGGDEAGFRRPDADPVSMRHRHSTPFEMAEIKFLVQVPMDCWRVDPAPDGERQ